MLLLGFSLTIAGLLCLNISNFFYNREQRNLVEYLQVGANDDDDDHYDDDDVEYLQVGANNDDDRYDDDYVEYLQVGVSNMTK